MYNSELKVAQMFGLPTWKCPFKFSDFCGRSSPGVFWLRHSTCQNPSDSLTEVADAVLEGFFLILFFFSSVWPYFQFQFHEKIWLCQNFPLERIFILWIWQIFNFMLWFEVSVILFLFHFNLTVCEARGIYSQMVKGKGFASRDLDSISGLISRLAV